MITIPSSLRKYFLSPKNTLPEDNKYYFEINKYLIEQLRCGVKQDIVSVSRTTKKHPDFFQVTTRNCEQAFASSCWNELKDDEKARTIYLLMQKTIEDKFPDVSIPNLHFIISQDLARLGADAICYHKKFSNEQDYVYIKPEYLEKSNGLMVVNLLTHELQHHYDFTMCEQKLLPHFEENYLTPNIVLSTTEQILKLPTSGEILNHRTGKMEQITPTMQEQILMLKHRFHPLTPVMKVTDISQVKTKEDMLSLFQYQAYLNTPLEKRAYRTGLASAQAVADNNVANHIELTYEDATRLNAISSFVEGADKHASLIEQLTGVSMMHICDLCHKKQYFSQKLIRSSDVKTITSQTSEELMALASKAFENYKQRESHSIDE